MRCVATREDEGKKVVDKRTKHHHKPETYLLQIFMALNLKRPSHIHLLSDVDKLETLFKHEPSFEKTVNKT